MNRTKIAGGFILGCTAPGQEGIVAMDFSSITEAVETAWGLNLPEWAVSGVVRDDLRVICRGECPPEKTTLSIS